VSLKDRRDPGFQQLEIHLAECVIGKALTEWVKVETLATGKGLGRGRSGRGRGPNKGPISVTRGTSERQKKPSVTPIFNKLPFSYALSRQRLTFQMDE
jgi:hypothetical protein